MAYRPKPPAFSIAATAARPGSRNDELDTTLRDFHQRLNTLEAKTATEVISMGKPGVLAPKPPLAKLTITAAQNSGLYKVAITEPQFIGPGNRGNPSGTPLFHRLEYSPYADFSRNVTQLPISRQTYWPVFETPGGTLHFRLQSSEDGTTWNQKTTHAPVSA